MSQLKGSASQYDRTFKDRYEQLALLEPWLDYEQKTVKTAILDLEILTDGFDRLCNDEITQKLLWRGGFDPEAIFDIPFKKILSRATGAGLVK